MSVLLSIAMFVLVLVSVFMVLIILMQRAKSDGGVGAALGGGMAEAAFGGESGNVLSKTTEYAAVIFFVLSFGLYLGYIYMHRQLSADSGARMPDTPALISTPADGADAAAGVPGGIPDAAAGALETPATETFPGALTPSPASEPAVTEPVGAPAGPSEPPSESSP